MLQLIGNISTCSYVQWKWLNVLSVFFYMYFNTLCCKNYNFFPEGMWGVQNSSGNSGEVGGYFGGQKKKMEIPGRRGCLREIASMVGVWIFSGTTP